MDNDVERKKIAVTWGHGKWEGSVTTSNVAGDSNGGGSSGSNRNSNYNSSQIPYNEI